MSEPLVLPVFVVFWRRSVVNPLPSTVKSMRFPSGLTIVIRSPPL